MSGLCFFTRNPVAVTLVTKPLIKHPIFRPKMKILLQSYFRLSELGDSLLNITSTFGMSYTLVKQNYFINLYCVKISAMCGFFG